MSRGASIPMRTLSPATERTEISISSPIMMLWLVFLVSTSIAATGDWNLARGTRLRGTSHSASPAPAPACAANRLDSRAAMAGKPLRSQLNQIRAWVREGRTDAWIAHQLEISASELRDFRRRNDLEARLRARHLRRSSRRDRGRGRGRDARRRRGRGRGRRRGGGRRGPGRRGRRRPTRTPGTTANAPAAARRRRGGRGRRRGGSTLEGSFDHGEQDGYGLWLDPKIKDNPVYAEHWAGHRPVRVSIEADQIVIRRAD